MTDSRTPRKTDVWQGTLALMVLKTLESAGPLHGFGIARRIEETSGQRLVLNPGTLYPTLLKLEQEGFLSSTWGTSDNNRRARFYALTRAGHKQVDRETREWQDATDIVGRFLVPRTPR
jgi:transcriptional regulator